MPIGSSEGQKARKVDRRAHLRKMASTGQIAQNNCVEEENLYAIRPNLYP